jgi:hypothetical protein
MKVASAGFSPPRSYWYREAYADHHFAAVPGSPGFLRIFASKLADLLGPLFSLAQEPYI